MKAEDTKQYFGEVNATLDELIKSQRDEQEIILKRDSANLPAVCNRIGQLTLFLQQKQMELQRAYKDVPEDCRAIARECRTKFSMLQELALQNHVLLESNLQFLEGIFQILFGPKDKPDTYDPTGLKTENKTSPGGGLLEVKV